MAREPEIKIGDVVRFRFGPASVEGMVREDRGAIGVGGRRLYLVTFQGGPGFDSVIELPAEDLEVQQPIAR